MVAKPERGDATERVRPVGGAVGQRVRLHASRKSPYLNVVKRIVHPGEVNRVRASRLDPRGLRDVLPR